MAGSQSGTQNGIYFSSHLPAGIEHFRVACGPETGGALIGVNTEST